MSCVSASTGSAKIVLNRAGYFEGPGFDFLVYENSYIGGRQGGIQMLLHGVRALDAGTLFCRTVDGERHGFMSDGDKKVGARKVDLSQGLVKVPVTFTDVELKHTLVVTTDGKSVTITARLAEPVDWGKISGCALKIEIFPEAYFGKTYMGGGVADCFHQKDMGRKTLIQSAEKIVVAPEDPLLSLAFTAKNARLGLTDERRDTKITGYIVAAWLPRGSQDREFSMTITPKLDPAWRRPPVIEVSQVGYHPDQNKVAVLELDHRITNAGEMRLTRLEESGKQTIVKSGTPVKWGPLFDYNYFTFDFTDVVTPGLYYLEYGGQQAGPFHIGKDVYKDVWCPTMDFFFPAQMCHVNVRDFLVIWHGACHLDDALQAPPNWGYMDGYHEGPETETKYQPGEHVPGLDWGGWHDAADFDLPAGNNAETVLWLALAYEEFHPDRDRVSISRPTRMVEINEPDGKNDMLQQVAYGMEYLLGLYHALGHIGAGIIEPRGPDYGRIGDPCSITDNLVYDSHLKPGQRKGDRSGTDDDRLVFTNRNTGGQYQFVQSAAVAARVLKDFDPALAKQCLKAAESCWTYEQTHDRVDFSVAYQPQEDQYHSWEMRATAELLRSTGNAKYRKRLLALLPGLEAMPAKTFGQGCGTTLVRALPQVKDAEFHRVVDEKAKALRDILRDEFAASPFGVDLHFGIWGNDWNVTKLASRLYFFVKQYPDWYAPEWVYAGLNYTFGRHPATNHSFVSGVGAKSATVAYGFNRDGTTYIPGGVVSGVALVRPKFPDYRARPWDWYETEYVISGGATYVFNALAAQALLQRPAERAPNPEVSQSN